MKKWVLLGWILAMAGPFPVQGFDFFSVDRLTFVEREPRDRDAIYPYRERRERVEGRRVRTRIFSPYLEARVRVREQTRSGQIYARAYFYDFQGELIGKLEEPTPVYRGRARFALPALLPGGETESIFFVVPEKVLESRNWRALVVFGDAHGADARVYPQGSYTTFEFPEREQVENRERVERRPAMDPLIEHVVSTRSERHPQITLFLRPPPGMTDASEARGVLAYCILAHRVEGIRRQLQRVDYEEEARGIMAFAEEHQLLLLGWGSRRLWDPRRNWDDMSPEEQRRIDEDFRHISRAWARGVEELAEKYGFPNREFLLYGGSGAAQYAARLALRLPEYFLAVHVHVPSSFDRPTPEGSRILWCLTTGELESGYERSLRFYEQCRELGYPMVYKAIIGLGHARHPHAVELGERFFEFALTQRGKWEETHAAADDSFATFRSPDAATGGEEGEELASWLEEFRQPPYLGDIINQQMVDWAERDMVPEGFRTPLPTPEIAEAWNLREEP